MAGILLPDEVTKGINDSHLDITVKELPPCDHKIGGSGAIVGDWPYMIPIASAASIRNMGFGDRGSWGQPPTQAVWRSRLKHLGKMLSKNGVAHKLATSLESR
jgi:hypothetical protein